LSGLRKKALRNFPVAAPACRQPGFSYFFFLLIAGLILVLFYQEKRT